MISISASKVFLEPQLVLRSLTVQSADHAKEQAALARVSVLGVSSLFSTEPTEQNLPVIGGGAYDVSIDGDTFRFVVFDREGALDTGIGPKVLLDKVMSSLGMEIGAKAKFHSINQTSHIKAQRYMLSSGKPTLYPFLPQELIFGTRHARLNSETVSNDLLRLLSSSAYNRFEMKSQIGKSYFYSGRTENLAIILAE
jgi:hypothetical protein